MINQSSFDNSPSAFTKTHPLITIYSYSFNSAIAAKVKHKLKEYDIEIECIHENLFLANYSKLKTSVAKTKKLITIDIGATRLGLGGEIIAKLMEESDFMNDFSVCRLGTPWDIAPAKLELAKHYFPDELMIYESIRNMLPSKYSSIIDHVISEVKVESSTPSDVPNPSFCGPF